MRHIEFLPLTDNRVLVILVLNERDVQNRILHTDRVYSLEELQYAANYLTATYAGQDILRIKEHLIHTLQEDRNQLNHLMQATIEVAAKALDSTKATDDYVVAGQSHLFELANVTNLTRVRQLFEVFTAKQDILHLLDQCSDAAGIQIFIGEESGYAPLDECSMVTAPYSANDQIVGVLGVIGPTRMQYDKIIPVVDITAKLLSAALNPPR